MTGSPTDQAARTISNRTIADHTIHPQSHPGAPASRPRVSPWAVLVVMCTGYFLVLLDVTVVNVALPQISAGLGAGVSDLQWVVDGYALALASLMLAGGTVGDLRGHKRMVLLGFAVFGAGSLGCGLAPGVGVLVAARVAQGVGAALLLPGTLAIISRAFPGRREQAKAIGVWAGIGGLALPAGPLLGGLLVDTFGWRAIFLLNVPIVVVASVAVLAIVTESADPRGRRLDLPGMVLGALLLVAVTLAVIEGGRAGLASPVVLAAAVATVPLLAAFVLVERRHGEQAMLPLGLLRRPVFTVANAAAGVMNLGTLGTLFVLPLFLQSVQGRSALAGGVALVPLFAPLAVLAPLAGRLNGRIGPRLPVAAGLVIAAAGLALLTKAGASSGYLVLLAAFLLWGSGTGILTPSVVAAAIGAVPGERAGLASAINNTARQASGAIGIAVAGAIAGQPVAGGSAAANAGFVTGFHTVALGAAGLYLLAALAAVAFLHAPGQDRASRP
ncbi:MAG TPA: MFS transporter [Streptosporangiaceae bacterium]|jgi:DHA2 family methylenomycin A resistance protein-like MFS transporter